MYSKPKYPIGTLFKLRPEHLTEGLLIWELISRDTMRCVSSGNTWLKGDTFNYPIKDIKKWVVILPKESQFDSLYLRLKSTNLSVINEVNHEEKS